MNTPGTRRFGPSLITCIWKQLLYEDILKKATIQGTLDSRLSKPEGELLDRPGAIESQANSHRQ